MANSQLSYRKQCCYQSLDDRDVSGTNNLKNIPQERSMLSTISDCIIIAIIYSIAMITEWSVSIPPHQQYIPGLEDGNNYNFDYPMLTSTVPTPMMLTLSFLTWLSFLCINGIIMWKYDVSFTWKSWFKFVYLVTRIVCFSFSTTSLITDIIKKVVGSPRPYYNEAYRKHENQDITQRDWDNANQSFISGHASESWALLFLLSIYLYQSYSYSMKCYYIQQNIAIYTTTNPHSYFLCNLWYKLAQVPLISIGVIFIPTYFALYVSLTRIIDYKHTAVDIVAGSIIGAFVSYITYLIFYNEMYLIFNFKQFKNNQAKQFGVIDKQSKIKQNLDLSNQTQDNNTTNKTEIANNNV